MTPNYYRFLAIAGLLIAGRCLQGTVFPRMTFEELTAQSELIIEGNVVRSWVAWDSEHKYIWTHYQVSVKDAVRGARAATVTVSEPGGSLDGIHQQFSGIVPYSIGEDAVLFLFKTPIGYWRAVGGPQGKFTIESDGRVHANMQGAAFFDRAGSTSTGTPLAALDGLQVPDFKARLRRLAAAYPFNQR